MLAHDKSQEIIEEDWYGNIKKNCLSVREFNHDHPFLRLPFSAQAFKHWFRHYSREYKKTGDKSFVHAMLVSVMISTLTACHQGYYLYHELPATPTGTSRYVRRDLDKTTLYSFAQKSTYYGKGAKFHRMASSHRPYPLTIVEARNA